MSDDGLHAQLAAYERCVLNRDQKLAELVLHPDFALVITNPALAVSPARQLAGGAARLRRARLDVRQQLLDAHGSTGVAFQTDRHDRHVMGTDRRGPFLITDVWLRGDGWRIWRRQSAAITAAALPAA